MSISIRSLLDTRSLSQDEINSLFERASEFELQGRRTGFFYQPERSTAAGAKVAACLFFEPSTRTRMSFQIAAYRLGISVLGFEAHGSSLTKGESLSDTVLNIAAMRPDVLIVRYGNSEDLDRLLPDLPIPVVNAGSGTAAHPTQALLDAYTIHRECGRVAGQRVLIVGDIAHSRVARSNFDVLARLGAEIGVFGPEKMLPRQAEFPHIRFFPTMEDGLEWATVLMGLRIQLERHSAAELKLESLSEYHERYGISRERLQRFRSNGIVLHPGPINHGVEFSSDVLNDPRCRVLNQVTNGVLIRASIMARILGL